MIDLISCFAENCLNKFTANIFHVMSFMADVNSHATNIHKRSARNRLARLSMKYTDESFDNDEEIRRSTPFDEHICHPRNVDYRAMNK
jgi:hypothetical protein